MKRRDLERQIAALAKANAVAWHLDPNASGRGSHDKWRFNGVTIPIPRHTEIGEGLAKKIIQQALDALDH